MYAYLYIEAAKLGIDVVGESQLVGYPTQYPSVSMMNYNTTEPNPRFWVLKLLKDNFGPGDHLVEEVLNAIGIWLFKHFLLLKARSCWLLTSVPLLWNSNCQPMH